LRILIICLGVTLAGLAAQPASATTLTGILTDPQGHVVVDATVRLLRRANSSRHERKTDAQGRYSFSDLDGGEYRITAEYPGFSALVTTILLPADGERTENLRFSSVASRNEAVTVTADISDVGVFEPDPAQRVMVRDQTLDANPGRPGMPVSIPGMPVESPAGGVKPPQILCSRCCRRSRRAHSRVFSSRRLSLSE